MNKIVVALFLNFIAFAGFAQVTSNVDSTQIKIGSAFNLTIKATADEGSKVVFPNQKGIGPFEVLEQSKVDTVLADKKMQLTQKYLLTQFDAGDYTLPRLSVYIDGKTHQTDLFNIKVTDVTGDTRKRRMCDIKGPVGRETATDKAGSYLGAIALCILAAIAA